MTKVKAENETWFYSKVPVYHIVPLHLRKDARNIIYSLKRQQNNCIQNVCLLVKVSIEANSANPDLHCLSKRLQGGTSFVDLLCFCSVLCLLCLCARLFICVLWSPAGKGRTSWLSFVVSAVSLSLSHWYPWSGVVLDCIDS